MLDNQIKGISHLGLRLVSVMLVILGGCKSPDAPSGKLFTQIPASHSHINFINELTYDKAFNIYTYRNFYNGGGVALGDVNRDGLLDIYFCGNMKSGRLYLNQGNFLFKDITEEVGLLREGVWVTGASFADVNGDGWLDLYLCKSGKPSGENRHNELFINQGMSQESESDQLDIPSFIEQAEQYNIADKGFSTHAAFFDYDKDGDLDCYLLNNSFRPIGSFDLRPGQRYQRDSLGGNKLYRNEGDAFVDVSEAAGVYGSIIGFGLGVTVGDVNRDSWPDIYVSNDFFERDYLYLNNQDGTFSESLEQQIQELSAASMGSDIADINNDGYPEIYVTDMLPRDDARMKTKTTFENWDKYQANQRAGYYRQFTRNVLQLNNGPAPFKVKSSYHERLHPDKTVNEPNGVFFSEIGRYADVHATDWSWGALIWDMDNDGYKDIFVANGIYQDLTDQDYINYIADPRTVQKIITKENVDFKQLIDVIPSNPIPNYAFHNNRDLTFTDKAAEWGLGEPGFSNGSAYGDLDNDGDMDLVINNTNMEPWLFRNDVELIYPKHRYLRFDLIGEVKNTYALGTQITAIHEGHHYFVEQMPMRGFESTMDHRPLLGLGEIEQVDTVWVQWPDGSATILEDVATNQTLELAQADAQVSVNQMEGALQQTDAKPLLTEVTKTLDIDYQHQENDFVDFDRDQLIYHMLSREGPKIAVADINGDGLEDMFTGGAKDKSGSIFIQTHQGKFRLLNQPALEADQLAEDLDAVFLDADGDGDQDLYVASGGNEYPTSSSALRDRLYLNDGKGRFYNTDQILPAGKYESTSCVVSSDYDRDGDTDLFVGIRLKPFSYGISVNGYILNNDGTGKFENVTQRVAPELQGLGMITDAIWTDYDQDGDEDLIITGEWMAITLFENDQGKLHNVSKETNWGEQKGFWNCVREGDFNRDGLPDYVVGNHGLNTRFKASEDRPIHMYINDFDQNGSEEQVITVYNGPEAYPLALRHDLVAQMPKLKKNYLKYENYKEQTITDMFAAEQIEKANVLEVTHTKTGIMMNQGEGQFEFMALPVKAQLAPIYGIWIDDMNQDGHQDILLGGNFHYSKPEVGIYAGNYGLMLQGDGKGNFTEIPTQRSGFFVDGQVRDMVGIRVGDQKMVCIAKNNAPIQVFTY